MFVVVVSCSRCKLHKTTRGCDQTFIWRETSYTSLEIIIATVLGTVQSTVCSYSLIDSATDLTSCLKVSQKINKTEKLGIVTNFTHGSSPFWSLMVGCTRSGVTVIHSPLLRNRNLSYIIFPTYMNETVTLNHCSLNMRIQHCFIKKNIVRNGW